MFEYAQPLNRLIEELRKIPGIGAKSAQRIAFYLLGLPSEDADSLAEAITQARRKIFYCSRCNAITHVDPCDLCQDPSRTDAALCIVEEPFNIAAIERTGSFHGRYFVLLGTLAPLKGKGPDALGLDKLLKRVKEEHFEEIILAMNPTVEGETTAAYLAKMLREFKVKLTRLALGLPVGSEIDFADQVTMRKALEGRTEVKD